MPLPAAFSCFETGQCNFSGQMFQVALMPYQWTLGAFAPVAIWAILLGIMWFRIQNIMHLAIIGIFINAGLVVFYPPARNDGIILLGCAIGVVLFQLFTNRIHHGSSM